MNYLKIKYNQHFIKSLIVCGAIVFVGLILNIIFGFNSNSAEPISLGGLILNIAIFELCFNILEFIYLRIRFNFATALTFVFKNILDIVLVGAIYSITRICITQSFLGSVIAGLVINNISSLLLFSSANALTEKENVWDEIVNKATFDNIKNIIFLNVVSIIFCICLTASQIVLSKLFLIACVINLVVSMLTAVFLFLPTWSLLRKKELRLARLKKQKVDDVQVVAINQEQVENNQ